MPRRCAAARDRQARGVARARAAEVHWGEPGQFRLARARAIFHIVEVLSRPCMPSCSEGSVFQTAVTIMLALTLLSAGCASNGEQTAGPGDGERAYFQLARAWCERSTVCLEAGGFGQRWG